jgi:hypothetical protein
MLLVDKIREREKGINDMRPMPYARKPWSSATTARQDYASSRGALGERKHAAAKWDQQLAALFLRSRWTQEQLTKAEGKSQTWGNGAKLMAVWL